MGKFGLIQTKLQPPPTKSDFVLRPQLVKKLDMGIQRKITLISAPAGYGKTTLASAWSSSCVYPVAWLSLDSTDNDIRKFLNYFIRAIQTVIPGVCEQTLALLDAVHLPPVSYLTNNLVNELSALPELIVLILDDYHLVPDANIQELMATFVKYQPAKIRLVIATRHDPMLDIVALRARGQLTEIRLHDLCFSEAEVRHFLEHATGHCVDPELGALITKRTEGWPAILRLACVALRDPRQTAELLDNLKSSNQFIMGYLVQEILNRLTPDEQLFLAYTSILDRFCAPLCDAVMATPLQGTESSTISSADMLSKLNSANLFLLPLDYNGVWYRYHQLFRDFLFHRLRGTLENEQIQSLHTAAGAWLEQQGYVDEAFDHYQQANDIEAQIALIASQRYRLLNETRWQQLTRYLACFSTETIEQHPHLLIVRLWMLYHSAQWDKIPASLTQMETLLTHTVLPDAVVTGLRGEMATLYALTAYMNSQPENIIKHADAALEKTPTSLWIVRSFARICRAGGLQMLGDWPGAVNMFYQGLDEAGNIGDHQRAVELNTLMNICWIAANVHDLAASAQQNINLSRSSPTPEIGGHGHYHLGCALYEFNDLEAAAEQFRMITEHPYVNYGNTYLYGAIGLATTYTVLGQTDAANDVVQALLRFFMNAGSVQALKIAHAFQAELALRQGQISTAGIWAAQFQEFPPFAPPFRCYYPHLTLVKVWLAQNTDESRQQAADSLDRLEIYLASIHNTRFLIETLALKALWHYGAGNRVQAAHWLSQALELACPGGMLRVFLDLGPQVSDVLATIRTDDVELRQYIKKLAAHFDTEYASPVSANGSPDSALTLSEALTDREIDILSCLEHRKTNKEIAELFCISENTVRYHLKNIYAKLNVKGRRQAAAKARTLHLLPTA